MKILISIFLITLVMFYNVTAQTALGSIVNDQPEHLESGSKIYPIPGSHLLQQEWQRKEPLLKAYIKAHANDRAAQNLKKTSAWGFTPGQAHTWWATNLNPSDPNNNKEYQVTSTCRAVGNNCYIFVEDSLWTNTTVNQAAVDSIRAAFEIRTPADPSKGIFQLDTMYFGNPPNVDADPKIIILILDIKDGFTGTGGYVAGYFYGLNEYTEADVHGQDATRHSNYAEIYYIDANPTKLKTSSGIVEAASTTAHEFQHMIFWNYSYINDLDKLTFINEGMSESASKLCGYGLRSPSLYYSNTNVDFLSWKLSGDVLEDYSRAAIFSWYLIEQFGNPITKTIVQNSSEGVACYDNAFQAFGSLHFNDVIKNFALAAGINDKTFDPKYGFTVSIPIKPTAVTYYSPNVPTVSDTVKPYGTRYVKFSGGQSLSVNINSSGSLEVKAIATGTAGTRVDNVTLGMTYTLSDFGTGHSSVVLAITNLTNAATVFTYTASGTDGNSVVELRYDYSEPVAASLGSMMDKDTLCVVFDAVQGGRLDSIRVALRRNTQITGGIWKYTGVLRPSPLGQLLASNLTAAGRTTPPTPYPVPWTNWVTIDLRSKNIGTNSRFAVGFRIDGDYPDDLNINRVMFTESPLPGEPTSLTYSAGSSSGPNWYYYTSNTAGDSVYTYLIRAYVSFGAAGGELTPASFVLKQNYPNPFNPFTTIQFQMPSKGFVTLKIYDMIGREVATLVNGFREAGPHNVTLDASNLSSGVYLYRITSGTYVETKKLVLIK